MGSGPGPAGTYRPEKARSPTAAEASRGRSPYGTCAIVRSPGTVFRGRLTAGVWQPASPAEGSCAARELRPGRGLRAGQLVDDLRQVPAPVRQAVLGGRQREQVLAAAAVLVRLVEDVAEGLRRRGGLRRQLQHVVVDHP